MARANIQRASPSRAPGALTPAPRVSASLRGLDARALFALIYATSVSAVYFALGVVGRHAQGLTPEIFIFAGIFFQLTSMTYAEGAALHPQRGGSPTFARYAFNELIGFISGWAIILDYILLVAVAALAVPAYLAVIWPALGRGDLRIAVAVAVVLLVAVDAVRGAGPRRLTVQVIFSALGLLVQVALVIAGLVLVFHGSRLTATVHLGHAPTLRELGFAIPITVVAFTGIEGASSLAVEGGIGPRALRRVIALASAAVVIVCVGITVVGIGALPVHDGLSGLGDHVNAPVLAIARALSPGWVAHVFAWVVGLSAAVLLLLASRAGMLGLTRAGYTMATHRQIPSAVGRLSRRWGTPPIIIGLAALAAVGLVVGANLGVLIDIYAFGALITFAIAHLSVIVMRFREPTLERDYRIPLSIPIAGAQLPLPALLGAVMAIVGWVILVIFHPGARYVGLGWLIGGILLYVIYRRLSGRPVLRRVVIPDRALRRALHGSQFGSILVPISGRGSDVAALEVAGRLSGGKSDDVDRRGTTIEAVYIISVPMQLPLDGPLEQERLDRAHAALAEAKRLGESRPDVEVATAVVRARGLGSGIVAEARRRGVEAIVLTTQPSGERLGAVDRSARAFDDVASYVIEKAPCRVILAAPTPARSPAGAPAPVVVGVEGGAGD